MEVSYKKDKLDELERLRDRLLYLHNCEFVLLDKILKQNFHK